MRRKRFIYFKAKDQVLRWNKFAEEYEIIGTHKDFDLHTDYNERYKDKIMKAHFERIEDEKL